jgi:hypothetical protein
MDSEAEAVCRQWYGSKWDSADQRDRPGEKMKEVWRKFARQAIEAIDNARRQRA